MKAVGLDRPAGGAANSLLGFPYGLLDFLSLTCWLFGFFDLGIFGSIRHGNELGFLWVHHGQFTLRNGLRWDSRCSLFFGRDLGSHDRLGLRFHLLFAARDQQQANEENEVFHEQRMETERPCASRPST